jgi:hypothetical protein
MLFLSWPATVAASEPTLDTVAAARGIAAGELRVGEQINVVAGTSLRGAVAERRSLLLHGIPLRGGFETRWRSREGQVRVVASRYPDADARLRPEQARIGLEQARERFAALVRPARAEQLATLDGELVYVLLLGQPVLAWEFEAPLVLTPEPSRVRGWISATSGALLEHEQLVLGSNQARVYDINPVHTPEPSLVTLTNIEPQPEPWAADVEVEPGHLTGTRARVFNCIDAPDGPYAPWHDGDECFATQRVLPDVDGDYFVELPNVSELEDNKDPHDLYAELAMYWHAEKFFTRLAALGVDGFPCERSNMVANFHRLVATDTADYSAYSNAYYTGECDIEAGPTMLVGQGSQVDFAYDGDVVYHELGHGIVEQLTPEGLLGYHYRSDGTLRDAPAINETIADYHTIMLTDRPDIGEYIASYTPSSETPWFRNADNEALCPDDLNGEEHTDGIPLTGALWSARTRIGGAKLDPVVLGSLPLLARDATLEQAAAALLEVAAAEVEAGVWTSVDRAQLERSLAGRNLLDCERVVDQPTRFEEPHKLLLRAKNEYVSPFWPGPLQYRHVVPPGSDNLIISFEVSSFGGTWSSGQLEPLLLVKRGSWSDDQAIAFDFELGPLGDLDEAWQVTGDWDEIHASTHLTDLRRQVLLRGLEPGEVVHVSFMTLDPEPTVLRELRFASVPSEELDNGSTNPLSDESVDGSHESACNCVSTGTGGRQPGMLFLLLFAFARVMPRSKSSKTRGGRSSTPN